VPGSTAPVTGIALSLVPTGRAIDVITRSTVAVELDGAAIIVLPGTRRIASLGDIWRSPISKVELARRVAPDKAPVAVRDKLVPGDLATHLLHLEAGELTVCAVHLAEDWLDPAFSEHQQTHFRDAPFRCEHVGATASVAVFRLAPQQRLDGRPWIARCVPPGAACRAPRHVEYREQCPSS